MLEMEALKSLVMLSLLMFILKKHRDLSVDNYRNELFSLRHKLFMTVSNTKNITHDNEAYKYFEENINNNIRFAHKLSFFKLYLTGKYFKYKKINFETIKHEKSKKLKQIKDTELQRQIKELEFEIDNAMFKFFLKTSLFFIFYLIYCIVFKSKLAEGKEMKTELKNNKVFDVAEILAEKSLENYKIA